MYRIFVLAVTRGKIFSYHLLRIERKRKLNHCGHLINTKMNLTSLLTCSGNYLLIVQGEITLSLSDNFVLNSTNWCYWSGAPCGFSGRFEEGSFRMKTKMKICSNLYWRITMRRSQISGLLKNEDFLLPYLLKMKIAFLKLLKTEDLKTPLENVKKMKTMS